MAYSITYINQCCVDLGGVGGHTYEIDGLNEICTLLSATAGHTYSIDALNAICTAMGYTAGWRYEIEALNAICTGGGGTGGHQYEIHAWQEIQTGSLLNQNEPETTALLARMDALGELPTLAQQANINNTIKALKSYCLFDRRFDALWVGRGYGEAATKLNWIKDAHNLTQVGTGTLTFQEAVGYKSNGSSTCLNTNYVPRSDAVNLSKTDAFAFIKLGGTIGTGNRCAMGVSGADSSSDISFYNNSGTPKNALNSSSNTTGRLHAVGYNGMARLVTEKFIERYNDEESDATRVATNLPNTRSLYILADHYYNDSTILFSANTTIFEIAGIGGYISKAEFLSLQSIFNEYIAAL